MAVKNIAKITSDVFALLEDLDADQRQRVIAATMALFGEGIPAPTPSSNDGGNDYAGDSPINTGKKAKRWMQQNSVGIEQLQEIFHFEDDGTVETIAADLPGDSKKEKTASAYLITGIRELLESDDPKVDNTKAVELCQHIGCYDKNNHTANRKALGNRILGSVSAGFTLPAPGLKAAAEVIKGESVTGLATVKRSGAKKSTKEKTGKAPAKKAKKKAKKAAKKKASSSDTGPKAAVIALLESGYFATARTGPEVQDHLKTKRGFIFGTDQLRLSMLRLVREDRLEREENAEGQYEYKQS